MLIPQQSRGLRQVSCILRRTNVQKHCGRKNQISEDIMTVKKGDKHVIGSQCNARVSGKGVNMLLNKEPHLLTKTKEADTNDTKSWSQNSKNEGNNDQHGSEGRWPARSGKDIIKSGGQEWVLTQEDSKVGCHLIKKETSHQRSPSMWAPAPPIASSASQTTTQRKSTNGTSMRFSTRYLRPPTDQIEVWVLEVL